MNRCNILTATDFLNAECENIQKLIKHPGTPDDVRRSLQERGVCLEEAIEVLQTAVREDINYETYCKQNVEASQSRVILPADLFDNGIVDY